MLRRPSLAIPRIPPTDRRTSLSQTAAQAEQQILAAAAQALPAQATPATAQAAPAVEPAIDLAPIQVEGSLAAPKTQDGGIAEQASRIQVRREAQRALSQRLVEEAKGHLDRANLESALVSYSQALELDPTNEEARAGLRQTQSIIGEPYAQVGLGMESQVEMVVVRRAQARLQAEEYQRLGDTALREGDYQTAAEEYRNGVNLLTMHPLIANEDLDINLMRERMDQAIQLRDESEEAQFRRAAEEAEEMQRRQEEEAQTQRDRTLQSQYDKARAAFLRDDYDEAENWTNVILASDPDNDRVRRLREVVRDARYTQTDAKQRKLLREEWQLTFDELAHENVPQTDALTFDLERWKIVSQRSSLEAEEVQRVVDPDREEVIQTLEDTRFEVRFDETGIEEVAAYLQNLTAINFHVSPIVLDSLDEEETTITMSHVGNSVYNVLNIISDTKENLTWKVSNGIVQFVTRDQAVGGQVSVNYPVHDLINPVRDYPGPEINVKPSGGIESNEELPDPRESNVISGDQLEILIQGAIAPDSWEEGASIRVVEETGALVVTQTPEIHKEIRNLLNDLREATGIMVNIQAQFVKVEDNFLEDIGVDFRGLGPPGVGVNGQDFNDFGDPAQAAELASEIGRTNDLGVWFDDGQDGNFRGRMENLYDRQLGTDEFRGSGGLSFQWTFLDDLATATGATRRLQVRAHRIGDRTAPVGAQQLPGPPGGAQPGRLRDGLRRPDRPGQLHRRPGGAGDPRRGHSGCAPRGLRRPSLRNHGTAPHRGAPQAPHQRARDDPGFPNLGDHPVARDRVPARAHHHPHPRWRHGDARRYEGNRAPELQLRRAHPEQGPDPFGPVRPQGQLRVQPQAFDPLARRHHHPLRDRAHQRGVGTRRVKGLAGMAALRPHPGHPFWPQVSIGLDRLRSEHPSLRSPKRAHPSPFSVTKPSRVPNPCDLIDFAPTGLRFAGTPARSAAPKHPVPRTNKPTGQPRSAHLDSTPCCDPSPTRSPSPSAFPPWWLPPRTPPPLKSRRNWSLPGAWLPNGALWISPNPS